MAIWLLQPDSLGNCCACGVRQNPCDTCSSLCTPLVVTNQEINEGGFVIHSTPTGTVFKFGGFAGSAIFTNKNSVMTLASTESDYQVIQGIRPIENSSRIPVNTFGFPNQPVNWQFEFQFSVNSGEIITLFSETQSALNTPSSQYCPGWPDPVWPFSFTNFTGPKLFGYQTTIDDTPTTCFPPSGPPTPNAPGQVISTSGGGGGNSANGQITLQTVNTGGRTSFTASNVIINGSKAFSGLNSSNPNPFNSSFTSTDIITAGLSNGSTCSPFDCTTTENPLPGQGNIYQMCYSFASYACQINPDIPYGNQTVFVSTDTESYFYQNLLQGCSLNGPTQAKCENAPGLVNQSLTFQVGPIRSSSFSSTGLTFPASMCVEVTCPNNGSVTLTTASGSPIDITSRLVLLNILPHGLP